MAYNSRKYNLGSEFFPLLRVRETSGSEERRREERRREERGGERRGKERRGERREARGTRWGKRRGERKEERGERREFANTHISILVLEVRCSKPSQWLTFCSQIFLFRSGLPKSCLKIKKIVSKKVGLIKETSSFYYWSSSWFLSDLGVQFWKVSLNWSALLNTQTKQLCRSSNLVNLILHFSWGMWLQYEFKQLNQYW